jgi:hypothetical protein
VTSNDNNLRGQSEEYLQQIQTTEGCVENLLMIVTNAEVRKLIPFICNTKMNRLMANSKKEYALKQLYFSSYLSIRTGRTLKEPRLSKDSARTIKKTSVG